MSAEHELAAAREAMRSMAEQLEDLYADLDEERTGRPSRATLEATVERLEAQVRALLAEKAELERRLAA